MGCRLEEHAAQDARFFRVAGGTKRDMEVVVAKAGRQRGRNGGANDVRVVGASTGTMQLLRQTL